MNFDSEIGQIFAIAVTPTHDDSWDKTEWTSFSIRERHGCFLARSLSFFDEYIRHLSTMIWHVIIWTSLNRITATKIIRQWCSSVCGKRRKSSFKCKIITHIHTHLNRRANSENIEVIWAEVRLETNCDFRGVNVRKEKTTTSVIKRAKRKKFMHMSFVNQFHIEI